MLCFLNQTTKSPFFIHVVFELSTIYFSWMCVCSAVKGKQRPLIYSTSISRCFFYQKHCLPVRTFFLIQFKKTRKEMLLKSNRLQYGSQAEEKDESWKNDKVKNEVKAVFRCMGCLSVGVDIRVLFSCGLNTKMSFSGKTGSNHWSILVRITLMHASKFQNVGWSLIIPFS